MDDRLIRFEEVRVPDTLSGLLRQVVRDMRIVLERDGVIFNMSSWADVDEDKCTVCAAGAFVLAECFPDGLNDPELNLSEVDITNAIENEADGNPIMDGIDSIRCGFFDKFLFDRMGYDIPEAALDDLHELYTNISNTVYDCNDYRDVVRWFNTAANFLESKGY